MKRLILIGLLCITAWQMNAQAGVIVRESSNSSATYTSLDSAIADAQDGDVLYLPGGHFELNDTIKKNISLIGVGNNPTNGGALRPTVLENVRIAYVTSFYLAGVELQNSSHIDGSQNVVVERCYSSFALYAYSSSNLVFRECIFYRLDGGSSVSAVNNVLVEHSVLKYISEINNATVDHSVIFIGDCSSNTSCRVGRDMSNSLFRNSILFTQPSGYTSSLGANQFINNVITWAGSYPIIDSLNTVIAPVSGSIPFFQSADDDFDDFFIEDYHIVPGSAPEGAGVNGVDCGIYGGSTPFKDGGIPFNPHIQSIQVDSRTDPNGNLHIQATVEAQNR